jgi:hypothetical protein
LGNDDGAEATEATQVATVKVTVRLTPLREAVISTAVAEETELVVTVNVPVVAPLATVTLDGTEATPEFELERLTEEPPEGAAIVSVTVPVALVPPTTLVGLREIADKVTPVTVRVADAEMPLSDAEIETFVEDSTA